MIWYWHKIIDEIDKEWMKELQPFSLSCTIFSFYFLLSILHMRGWRILHHSITRQKYKLEESVWICIMASWSVSDNHHIKLPTFHLIWMKQEVLPSNSEAYILCKISSKYDNSKSVQKVNFQLILYLSIQYFLKNTDNI